MNVHYETDRPVAVISLDRPAVANAIDRPTADKLVSALQHFDADAELSVAVLEEQHPGRLCRPRAPDRVDVPDDPPASREAVYAEDAKTVSRNMSPIRQI